MRQFAAAWILHFAFVRDINDLLAFELVAVVVVAAAVLQNFVAHPRKHVRPVVVIVLRPLVERMIVALGAAQLGSEENLRHGLGAGDGLANRAIKIRRRIEIAAAARGDQFARELVERLVLGDALANPAVERLDAFTVEQAFLGAQQIGPFERPEIGELRAFEQPVDQPGAFL